MCDSAEGPSMEKYYLVVRWVDEDEVYSVVSSSLIINVEKRLLREHLTGDIIDIEWEDESGAAEVIDVDSRKSKMECRCRELSSEAGEKSLMGKDFGKGKRIKIPKNKDFHEDDDEINKRKKTCPASYDIVAIKNKLLSNKENQGDHSTKNDCKQCKILTEENVELTEERDILMNKVQKWKKKYNKIKENKEPRNVENTIEETIEIASGVAVNKVMLEHHTAFSNTAPIFARKLMTQVFTPPELASSSLRGKQSNANKAQPVLPALPQHKLTAIIEHTLKMHPTYKDKSKLMDSMASYLKERRNKNKTTMLNHTC